MLVQTEPGSAPFENTFLLDRLPSGVLVLQGQDGGRPLLSMRGVHGRVVLQEVQPQDLPGVCCTRRSRCRDFAEPLQASKPYFCSESSANGVRLQKMPNVVCIDFRQMQADRTAAGVPSTLTFAASAFKASPKLKLILLCVPQECDEVIHLIEEKKKHQRIPLKTNIPQSAYVPQPFCICEVPELVQKCSHAELWQASSQSISSSTR